MKNCIYPTRIRKSQGLGGIAEYFDIDSTLVRLAWVVLSLMSVGGV